MDGQKLEQLSSSSGIPLDLLSRSIQARAEATGVSSDDILNNWSGGDSIPTPVSEVTTVEKTEADVENQVIENETEEIVEELPLEIQAEEISAIATVIVDDAPPPVSISQKILKSIKYGLGFGVLAGFIQGLLASSFLYDGLILEAETQKLIAEYSTVSFVLIVSLTTAFIGALNSLNIKKFLETNYEGFGVLTNDRESIYTGVGLGLVFGSSSAFYIVNSVGQTILGILPEDPVTNLISVGGAFWRIVILSTIIQAAISVLSMILGVPKGLESDENTEANKIRNRIVGSIVIPLGAIVVGGVISVAIAQVFLNFHD